MGHLDRVTLTGVDDKTDLVRLKELTVQYPFVEWGVLLSLSMMGKGRYPSAATIHKIRDAIPMQNLSMHVCGRAVEQFLDQPWLVFISGFNRYQLNFNLKTRQINDETVRSHLPKLQIITQQNNSNYPFTKKMIDANAHPNWHILFDASGGRGELGNWKPPFKGRYTGYAGGLGPKNVLTELSKIEQKHKDLQQTYWIDMESKLRTNDCFDLDLCESVLKKVHSSSVLVSTIID